MRRREFLALLGGIALARPTAALGQEAVRRMGMLMPFAEDDPEAVIRVAAFRQKLRELGWAVGRNLGIEARWSGDDLGRTKTSAAELAAIAPDVILAAGTPALAALTNETRHIPIVFVGQGLQGRQARRPAGAAADQVRAGDQSQDCQGARPQYSALTACPRPTRSSNNAVLRTEKEENP